MVNLLQTILLKVSLLTRQWWHMLLTPELRRQRQADLSKFEDRIVFVSNFHIIADMWSGLGSPIFMDAAPTNEVHVHNSYCGGSKENGPQGEWHYQKLWPCWKKYKAGFSGHFSSSFPHVLLSIDFLLPARCGLSVPAPHLPVTHHDNGPNV